ncbi:hypothetical protein V490_03611 [Pseudogymnoascus sp. VKM F-3557]|nr:hypothetical protein V490_03611 [Pseudogymnoascus sp. VKM F-3557]
MESLSANDRVQSASTTADDLEHNASVKDNRITRIFFGDGPDLDTNEQVDTLEESVPPRFASPISKKRKIVPSQDREPEQRRDIKASLGKNETATKSGLKELHVVKAAQSGASVLDRIVQFESPWARFCEKFELNLGGYVSIVADRSPPYDIFMVKRLKGSDAVQRVRMLRRVRHQNFHNMVDCFSFEGSHYAVFQHLPVTLDNIVYSPPYPTELELAAALAQIVKGLKYLATCGLEHGSLDCSSILVGTEGDIKIAGQECCSEMALPGRGSSRDMVSLMSISMKLMQKSAYENGAGGAHDMERWPADCKAVDFLAKIQVARSFDELLDHPLLQLSWKKENLKWMVALAAVSSHRGFRYHEKARDVSEA